MACSFDGNPVTYVDLGDHLDGTAASFTVMARIQRAATGARHEIVSKEGAGPASGYALYVPASGLPTWGVFDGATPTAVGTTDVGTDLVHVCGVWNSSSGELEIWVDGVQEDTTAATVTATVANAINLNVARSASVSGREFEGSMEDVRYYSRALDEAEILTIVNGQGCDGIVDGLELHLPMADQPSGTPAGIRLLNLQTVNDAAGPTTSITLSSYAVPSDAVNPVLVVVSCAEDGEFTDTIPSSVTFDGDGLTERETANTTVTNSAGTAVLTLGVSPGDSGDIVASYPGDGVDGVMLHAFVVNNALDSVDVVSNDFNNSGNVTDDLTTTVDAVLGISAVTTGANSSTTGITGTNHSEVVNTTGGGPQYSGTVGIFPAYDAGSYSTIGFTFSSVNRSSIALVGLDLVSLADAGVQDVSDSDHSGMAVGVVDYVDSLAA